MAEDQKTETKKQNYCFTILQSIMFLTLLDV